MSNYTDFDMLDLAEGVNLFFTTDIQQLKQADIIIIPGTKNTIADMLFLKQTGLDSAIRELFAEGKQIYGVCGGYQILGRRIFDPQSIEGEEHECEGIGILPVETIMESEKQTVRREFRFIGGDAQNGESEICMGYEIHMGKTTICDEGIFKPVALFDNSALSDGYYHSQRCFGTYLHGIFDNKIVLEHILSITKKPYTLPSKSIAELREQEFDKLAKVVRENVDLEQLYKILEQ
jgi:adenosylcobyric acid synthase